MQCSSLWTGLVLLSLGWALGSAGCASAPQTPAPMTALEIDAREYRRLYEAALLELRQAGFILDRQDYRLGVVTTKPLFVPSLIEPWHGTNSTPGQAVEGTFNQLRRKIRVTLAPSQSDAAPAISGETQVSAGAYQLTVMVETEQRQRPTNRLEGSTDASRVIGSLSQAPTSTAQAGAPPDHWITIGRDPRLEERLLHAIVRRSIQLPDSAPAIPAIP